ncbi:MAG: PstS family phosphate ABC transporter substrate-binding protein [Microcystaceae cyanobacterium]
MKLRQSLLIFSSTAFFTACASVDTTQIKPIKVDGSSTVAPITEAVLTAYEGEARKAIDKLEIHAEISGTGGGFKKFCAGETEINAASRPISLEEMKTCTANDIPFVELPIAFDAITVVVHPSNPLESLTVDQLKKMWQPEAEGKITNWQQVDGAFPNQTLNLFGPDKASGTYDYFTETIMGQAQASRTDYVFSEDDDALVKGVAQDPNALGYFGYAYYDDNKDQLKALAINKVIPSPETVETGQYQPLARPLFIYVNAKAAQDNPALEAFVKYYLKKAPELVSQVGYIPLPKDGYQLADIQFQRFEVGTVFDGKIDHGLTISDLLRKQAQFEAENNN